MSVDEGEWRLRTASPEHRLLLAANCGRMTGHSEAIQMAVNALIGNCLSRTLPPGRKDLLPAQVRKPAQSGCELRALRLCQNHFFSDLLLRSRRSGPGQ